MPSLDNLEEDIVIKAAILCTAGQYSIQLSDFKWSTIDDAWARENIIWAIEALQKQYPRYLQYARWVAIREGVNLIEGKRKGYRKAQDPGHRFTAHEEVPRPNMGKLMQEEWDRHFSRYRPAVQVSNTTSRLARFLNELKTGLDSERSDNNQSSDKPDERIPVDVDGNGTIIRMTPEAHALWNMLINKQPLPDEPTRETDASQ
jgi:hypothetical protein